MEYTVQKLARLAGISTRTLRYYDAVDLLKPARITSSGYRIYGAAEVDQLQQIMFYRELGVELGEIRQILDAAAYSRIDALRGHQARLLERKCQIERLITNVEKTIAMAEGEVQMTDKEKFAGFKEKMIQENEEKYGKEIREKYGDDTINASNGKLKGMSQEQYVQVQALSARINETLKEAITAGDPAGDLAQEACRLHKEWLMNFWDHYTPEAHMGLAQMYVDDARFTAYYDQVAPGATVFLRDAMRFFTSKAV